MGVKKSIDSVTKVTTQSPPAIKSASIHWIFHSSYVNNKLFVGYHIVDYGSSVVNEVAN